jgi:transcriptional regulator with XRE-family HTH domain
MEIIGKRLREERNRLGYTQEEMGEIAKINKNTQLKYENGSRYPDALYLQAISEVGADVSYIITGIRSDRDIEKRLRGMLTMLKRELDSKIEKAIEQMQSEQQQ